MSQTAKLGQDGFTLIELMVTLTIGAILILVAIPNFTAYKRNAELTTATNTLLAGINAARNEAMKRNLYAMVVPTNNGTDWTTGWVVFVDADRSQTYTPADTLVMSQNALMSYFTVSGNQTANASPPYIMFDASGYSKTKTNGFGALTLEVKRNDLSGAQLYEQIRRVKIASTGRARTCRPTSANDINCSASVND